MADQNQNKHQWNDEDNFWRSNFQTRPYGTSGKDYEFYQPGYRYGYDAANKSGNRSWADAEKDLASKWESFEQRGESTWEQVKDAVRDAWDRVTGKHTVGTH
ncbi:MAG: hypothetical protein ABI868_11675 [Acidobacteriota bacterium]